jgi:hypothetical protein
VPVSWIIVVLTLVAGAVLDWWRRNRRYQRVAALLREGYAARFDPVVEHPRLDELVRIALDALGDAVVRSPEFVIPASGDTNNDDAEEVDDVDPDTMLRACVEDAAARFGVPMDALQWSFVPETTIADVAGCVIRRGGLGTITLDGTTAAVEPAPDGEVRSWCIEVAAKHRRDRAMTASVVGHEMAHAALQMRHVRLTPTRRNEELTDVAAILAGFGPVMLEVAQRERFWMSNIGRMHLRVGGAGYLHREAVRYVTERRSQLAHGVECTGGQGA